MGFTDFSSHAHIEKEELLDDYKKKIIPEGIPDHAIISAVITQGTQQEPEKNE